MKLGIDASNLRAGGGVTHLVELLRAADPVAYGFANIVIWGGKETLQCLEDRPWLEKCYQPCLDLGLPYRVFWQRFRLSTLAFQSGCDLLFVPGGAYVGDFRPIVAMCRNMIPFVWLEIRRYGLSLMTLKWILLRWSHSRSYRNADGLIFLTSYARETVLAQIKSVAGKTITIPHGINSRFSLLPRLQRPIEAFSVSRPFQILYVSSVDWYKHQWHVADAVAQLRKEGFPLSLDLIGPAYAPALVRLTATLGRVDPGAAFIKYHGPIPHAELHARFALADMCIFASSCENMPNILLESMASGLPIACSKHGPMPELLGDAGIYFDPEKPKDISAAIRQLILSKDLRERQSKLSFKLVEKYSWQRTAGETFRFLSDMVRSSETSRVVRLP